MKPLVAVATSTLLALSGVIACAPLNKDQCQAANWQQIGYQNGLKGRDAARFEEERRACAEHGLGADATGWKLGYAQGLGLYCRPEHGYDVGRRGESYGDVCPRTSMRSFARPTRTAARSRRSSAHSTSAARSATTSRSGWPRTTAARATTSSRSAKGASRRRSHRSCSTSASAANWKTYCVSCRVSSLRFVRISSGATAS